MKLKLKTCEHWNILNQECEYGLDCLTNCCVCPKFETTEQYLERKKKMMITNQEKRNKNKENKHNIKFIQCTYCKSIETKPTLYPCVQCKRLGKREDLYDCV